MLDDLPGLEHEIDAHLEIRKRLPRLLPEGALMRANVGTDGGGSCLASFVVTWAAQSAGAGATTEISSSATEGAATKATSASFW